MFVQPNMPVWILLHTCINCTSFMCVYMCLCWLTLFRNDGPRKIANSNGMFRRTTAVRIVLVFAKCRLHSPHSPYGMSVEHCISKRKRRRGKSDVHNTKPLFKASGLDKIVPCFTMKLQHCRCLWQLTDSMQQWRGYGKARVATLHPRPPIMVIMCQKS